MEKYSGDPVDHPIHENSFKISLYTELGEEAAVSGNHNEAEKYFERASEEIESQLEYISENSEEILKSSNSNEQDLEKLRDTLEKQNECIQKRMDEL